QSYPVFEYMREEFTPMGDLAAWWITSTSSGQGEGARNLRVSFVTPNLFGVLGVRPWAGRLFGAEDWTPQGEPAVILFKDFAVRQFGSASAAMARTLTMGGNVHTVIGVPPPGYVGVQRRCVDVFVTMQSGVGGVFGENWRTNKEMRWLQVVVERTPE